MQEGLCHCGCGKTVSLSIDSHRNFGKRLKFVKGHHRGNTRHGKRKLPEYGVYASAKSRCNNPNDQAYKDYGARGIQFNFKSFDEFFVVLGNRPIGYTLERIDNNGNYDAGNVKWATRTEQLSNRRLTCSECTLKGWETRRNAAI